MKLTETRHVATKISWEGASLVRKVHVLCSKSSVLVTPFCNVQSVPTW